MPKSIVIELPVTAKLRYEDQSHRSTKPRVALSTLSRRVEDFFQMPARYQGRPGESFREASGVFFPEALEYPWDHLFEFRAHADIRELRKALGLV
jgi:hypothetical protein